MTEKHNEQSRQIVNSDLLMAYCLPYLAYVGIASLGSGRISDELGYILKIIIVPALLFWAWKWYVPFTGPKSRTGSIVYGIVFGIAGLVIWCLLLWPFVDIAGEPWEPLPFFMRLFAASLIVPVFEEVFIRGYALRAAFQWDLNRKDKSVSSPLNKTMDEDSINTVEPGAWSVMAIVISTTAFTVGHLTYEWPAAIAYSILISILWIIRKDLLSCIVAHGVTNFTLGLYVWYSGHWGFW